MTKEELKVMLLLSLADDKTQIVLTPKQMEIAKSLMERKGADDYERAIEQSEHDMLYEPTYNSEDGSM